MFSRVAVFAFFISFGPVHCVPVAKGINANVMATLYEDFQKNQQNADTSEIFVLDNNLEQRFQDPQFVKYLEKFLENFQKMSELLQTMQTAGEDTKSVQAALSKKFGSRAFINFLTNLLQQFGISNTNIHSSSNTVTTSQQDVSEQHSSEYNTSIATNGTQEIVSNSVRNKLNDVLDVDTGFGSSSVVSHESSSSSDVNSASTTSNEQAINQKENAEELRRQINNAHYKFSSYVNDNIKGELQSRKEVRDGAKVTGMYSSDDGFYSRTTWYKADEGGFVILKEEVKPSQKRGHLDGSADVKTYQNGATMQYHITSKDIQPVALSSPSHL